MLFEDLRAAIAAAPPGELPAVSVGLWKAFSAGAITEEDAAALSALIEARQAIPRPPPASPARRTGARPRTGESLGRRRRWAASGAMPPQLAAAFTLAEQAALAVVACEAAKRGDCRLSIEHVAALAGVGRSTVKRALREARALGLIACEERRLTRWRSDTNIVRVLDRAWVAWLRMRADRARPPAVAGGGGQGESATNTQAFNRLRTGRRHPKDSAEGQGRHTVATARDGIGSPKRVAR